MKEVIRPSWAAYQDGSCLLSVLRVFKAKAVQRHLNYCSRTATAPLGTAHILPWAPSAVSANNFPKPLPEALLMTRSQEILYREPRTHYSKMIKTFWPRKGQGCAALISSLCWVSEGKNVKFGTPEYSVEQRMYNEGTKQLYVQAYIQHG